MKWAGRWFLALACLIAWVLAFKELWSSRRPVPRTTLLRGISKQGEVERPYCDLDRQLVLTTNTSESNRLFSIWDMSTEKSLFHLLAPGDTPSDMTNDWLTFVTCEGNLVKLWDTNSGSCRATIEHDESVYCAILSPSGETLVTIAGGGKLTKLWQASSGKELASLDQERYVHWAAYSADGATVATLGFDDCGGAITLWNVATGATLGTYPTAHDSSSGPYVFFAPDGRLAFQGTDRRSMVLLDWTTNERSTVIEHARFRFPHRFTPDGHVLAIGCKGTIVLFDTGNGRELRMFEVSGSTACLSFSPDKKLLAVEYEAQDEIRDRLTDLFSQTVADTLLPARTHVVVLEVASGKVVSSLPDSALVKFAAKSTLVTYSKRDDTIRLWDVPIPYGFYLIPSLAWIAFALALSFMKWKRVDLLFATARHFCFPKHAK